MIVQVRRSLRSWTRRAFMYPVLGFLVIAALGGAFETVQERLDRSTMPGTLVDVGGHSLHIHCTGSGTPTVVLEGGQGEMRRSSDGSRRRSLAGPGSASMTAPAGGGEASPHRVPGAEWRRNSIRCSIGRMCLVRTCWRGTRSAGSTFSTSPARYADQVAGLVLIDATPPDVFDSVPTYPSTYAGLHRVTALAPSVARFGGMRVINKIAYGGLPARARSEVEQAPRRGASPGVLGTN